MKVIFKIASTSLILSVTTIFIKKWNILTYLKISDLFLFLSILLTLFLVIKKQINLSAVNKIKKYIIIFFLILILGSISSLYIYGGLPLKDVIIEYLRLLANSIIFILIILFFKDKQKINKLMYFGFLPSIIVIPLVYLFPNLISNGFLMDSSNYRFAGLFNDPNYYANFYIIPSIFLLHLFSMEKKIIMKIIFFITLSLSFGLLIWTGSRSGLLGLIVSIVTFLIFYLRKENFKKTVILSMFIAFSIFSGIIFIPQVAKKQVQERVGVIQIENGNITITKGQSRGKIWEQSLNYLYKNPLGYGPSYSSIININSSTEHRASHSLLFEIMLIGGIPLIALLLYLMIQFTKHISSIEFFYIISAISGVFASSMFIDSLSSRWIWILFALTNSLISIKSTQTKES